MIAETMIAAEPAVEPAVETTTYVEVTRKARKPRQNLIGWLDLPRIYGQAGYDANLTGSDMATLRYLYGPGIRFNQIKGRLHRVTLRPEKREAA